MIYLIAGIAALSGLLFGFDEGVIAGILGTLTQDFQLSKAATGFLASALPLGALFASLILGSALASALTKKVGRRSAILFAAVLFTASALCAACAPSLNWLIVARVVTGIAIGIAGVMTPLYIAEMTPAAIRGRLVSAYQLAITIGILIGYGIDYLFVYGINWRLMFAAGAIPSLILLIGMWYLPESHRWFILTGQVDRARRVLARLHTTRHIKHEIEIIDHTIQEEGNSTRWRELCSPTVLPALILAMALFVLQQISGINVVIYYAPTIFKTAGFSSTQTQIIATVGIGVINVLATLFAMWLIEQIGRKKLLYIGFSGTAITLIIISLGSTLHFAHLGTLTFVAVLAYIAFFAIALGPIPHLMMSEVFPIHVRNTGMGIASICNWGFNFLVVFAYPLMIAHWGLGATFGLYAVTCAIGFVFTYFYVPETKGATLEAITEHLIARKPLRDFQR